MTKKKPSQKPKAKAGGKKKTTRAKAKAPPRKPKEKEESTGVNLAVRTLALQVTDGDFDEAKKIVDAMIELPKVMRQFKKRG